MSYSRSQYYERSRSRSRDRKYRREYRENGDRYSYPAPEYGAAESSYDRRKIRSSKAPVPPGTYASSGGHRSSSSTGASHYRESYREQSSSSYKSAHYGGAEPSSSGGGKIVLAVFNLSVYTTEPELYDIFSKFGPIKKATVVLDAKTGRSRGFGFVYYDNAEDAKVAIAQGNGIEIRDRRIRVDFSVTHKPHDPTPGVYYGKVSAPPKRGRGGGRGGGRGASSRGPGHSLGPPPVSVGGGMRGGAVASAGGGGGYYHCEACEIEARERERWERDARRYEASNQYYYQEKYVAPEPRSRERSAVAPRAPRNDYYRSGNVR
ncbi:transformer-2 protein homolog alpha-like [Uranotaenia lowii]|uniref:transformer-2 protein homolog alpha-like n=1 Tax=Uranotaenia lowii TaxID=190385 RepID=UPI0024790300|nr:transformer-2 protein homolog alpha-like [Uranotaenia lowii]